MSVMRSCAQMLAAPASTRGEEQTELLETIVAEVDRVEHVVNGLIELARPMQQHLEPTRLNLKLVKRLGGILPKEAVAIPLVVRGAVHLVLYGDNGKEVSPIGPLDVLEGAVARAARILERTLAARERKSSGSVS